jgi:NADH-quinone oxidoreductase subunit F
MSCLSERLSELIYEHGGGIANGRKIKAIMPAGASSSLIVADEKALDTAMDYENVPSVGAQLGSASIIVVDDSVNMDWLVNKTTRFFNHESCGKCTPCREGTYWMKNITNRIVKGQAKYGDVELLYEVASQIKGKCLCALGEFSTEAVISGIDRFRTDFDKKTAAMLPKPWKKQWIKPPL